MANREACELYIEQEIDSGLEEGKTPYTIGKELSEWVAKMFEVRMPEKTLETRAYRRKHKNEPSPEKITSNEVKTLTPVTKSVRDDRYQEALKTIKEVILDAKLDKWKNTSQEALLKDLDALKGIVDPSIKQTKRQKELQQAFWNADHVISERAAFHVKNSNIGDQMRNGDKIFSVPRIIDIEGSRSFLSVRVVTERNLKGARAQ